ncbi:MAG: RidA family protein [Pirellulaceae bacterium]
MERTTRMTPEEKLAELGITLPEAPPAVANYVPWIQTGNVIMTSGQLPFVAGQIQYAGKCGGEVTVDDGYQAARLCAINAMAQLKAATGKLSSITKILRLEGNVHSSPGFQGQPQVLNGASDLFFEVFGDRGKHTRTALGIHEMPLNAAVQLSVFAEIEPD